MRTDDVAPGLIGRDHPAAMLRAEIGRAVGSHGGLVLVTGEAGIGKTTLVTSAAEEARRAGALVLSGSCWDSDNAPGYWPWTQVIRGIRRGLDPGEWQQVEESAGGGLTALLGEAASGAVDDFELYDAVTTALVSLSQRRPVVVVLDDLHWADAASLRLLEFVAKHTWFERLLVIGTYRDEEHPLRPLLTTLEAKATPITLAGLEPDEVGELVSRTVGQELAGELLAEVHRRTGGNPFFVEQTARLWRSGGSITAVAPGVRDAVRRRLSLLPAAVARLLTDAAVLGREFHRQLLAATVAAPVPHVDRLLDEALTARLVIARGGGVFAFTHDLVRETLYDALDETDLPVRHAAVVRALDRSAELAARMIPADLARHAYLAGEHLPPARAIDHLLAAAADAEKRLAIEESIGHTRRAYELSVADEPRRRVTIALAFGHDLHLQGEREEARRAFEEAIALARALDEPELLARVALTVSRACGRTEAVALRADLLREAHHKLIGEPVPAGRDEELLERLTQELAIHLAVHGRRGQDDEVLAFGLWAYHDSIWGPGTAGQRVALTTELMAVARRRGDLETEHFASSLRFVALLELGDPRYLDQFRDYLELGRQNDTVRMGVFMAVDESIIDTLTGRFAEAQALLDEIVAQNEEHDHEHWAYMVLHHRWALWLHQGRFDALAEVHGELRRSQHPCPALLEALTAFQRGDVETALLHRVDEPRDRGVRPLWLRYQALAAAATQDPELCELARAGLEPHREHWAVSLYGWDVSGPMVLWLAVLDAAQGRWADAIEGFTAARRSADRLQARPWSVEAKSRLAAVLLARAEPGDAEAAAVLGGEVEAEAAELGMPHILTRIRPLTPPATTGSREVARLREAIADGREAHAPHPAAPTPAQSVEPVGPSGVGRAEGSGGGQPVGEFRRDGSVWSLAFAGRTVHLPDAKGLHDLRLLLNNPGTELPAVHLLDPSGGQTVVAVSRMGGDAVLDEEAKAQYRRRLEQLDEEIDQAVHRGDDTRAADHDREREALLEELRAASGLGGRNRRLGDEAERARKTVTARIRDVLRKLDQLHPELASHLRATISTGATCRYQPDQEITWHL